MSSCTEIWNLTNARVGFFGSAAFSVFALEALLDAGVKPVMVLSQPGRAKGRGQKITPTIVSQVAQEHGLPLQTPEYWCAETIAAIAQARLDVAIVVAYGLILTQQILDLPRYGCLNIHPSPLPRWRGAAPIQRAIAAGDQDSAVCIIRMDKGVDTGDILWQENTRIDPDWDAGMWHDVAGHIGAKGLLEVLSFLPQKTAIPQSSEGISYAAMISPSEAQINFHHSATQIVNHIRAFSPKPGSWCLWRNKRLRLFSARIIAENIIENCQNNLQSNYGIGQVCDSQMTIHTAQGMIRPQYVQLEGKKKMLSADFLRGHDLRAGEYLTGRKAK